MFETIRAKAIRAFLRIGIHAALGGFANEGRIQSRGDVGMREAHQRGLV